MKRASASQFEEGRWLSGLGDSGQPGRGTRERLLTSARKDEIAAQAENFHRLRAIPGSRGAEAGGGGGGGGGTWYQEGQEDAHTQKPHLAAAHASVCLHPMCICVRASENRACSERSPVWNRTPSWARSLRPDNLSARLCRWLGLIGDPRCGQLGSLT